MPALRTPLRDRTDAQLLRLAREGDQRAYEAIVARYREPLRRSCARIAPERAEDAVQHTLLSAWLALERGADVRELRPWLYSIARNAAIDQARGVRLEQVELGAEVPGGEDPASADARRREVTEVLEAIAALPERQRRALVETAVHGRATEAVADDLGLSGGALRQLVHRARTTVRSAVPSVAFPMPAWLVGMLGEESAKGGALVLGTGSGAAVIAKATATVATVGAVVAGGAAVDRQAERSTRSAATTVQTAATTVATPAAPTGSARVSVPATATVVSHAAVGDTRVRSQHPRIQRDEGASARRPTAGDVREPGVGAGDGRLPTAATPRGDIEDRAPSDARSTSRGGREQPREADRPVASAASTAAPATADERSGDQRRAGDGVAASGHATDPVDGGATTLDRREGSETDRPSTTGNRGTDDPGSDGSTSAPASNDRPGESPAVTTPREARPRSDRIPLNGDPS